MEEYVLHYSIQDVINILEAVPVIPYMVPGITLVQIMNRAPLAHLSIERALKFLIDQNGGSHKPHHNLHTHLDHLRQLDPRTTLFLDKAFEVATEFYGFNYNRIDQRHCKSLDVYFASVGTADAFDRMRYWELNQSTNDNLIKKISITIHGEILRAISEIYLGDNRNQETVVDRVERIAHDAMFSGNLMVYSPGSEREASVKNYIRWVVGHPSRKEALGDAIQRDFRVGDDVMNEIIATAYKTLTESRDPAIKYLTTRLTVLPRQPRDVLPPVEWLGPEKEKVGRVTTPAGTRLC